MSPGEPGGRRQAANARTLAVRVLERTLGDDAFAAAALDVEIDRHPDLDPRDRGLLTELVYGVLRTRAVLVKELTKYAPRGLPKDGVAEHHLLVAAYQILLLDRVPAHAAVDAAVTALRLGRSAKLAGFANAVLRKVAASGKKLDRGEAIVGSVQPWLLRALEGSVGQEEARALLGASVSEDLTALRMRPSTPPPDWLATATVGRASPLARLVPRGGNLRRREGYGAGAFVLQEEGAQAVALALGARPGDRVLDACAGRGQKTTLLREQVGPDAELWAVDLYPEKLSALGGECTRLGLAPPRTAAVDWTVGEGPVPAGFDRVLVDAPCTGTGTLRHRPEIALRLAPGDPARLGELGASILRRAAGRARPGGRVVFAVCSVLREECEAVVERVLDLLEPAPFDAPEVAAWCPEDRTAFRLLPGKHGTDGFFVASFLRR